MSWKDQLSNRFHPSLYHNPNLSSKSLIDLMSHSPCYILIVFYTLHSITFNSRSTVYLMNSIVSSIEINAMKLTTIRISLWIKRIDSSLEKNCFLDACYLYKINLFNHWILSFLNLFFFSWLKFLIYSLTILI